MLKMCGDCEQIKDLETGFHKDPTTIDGYCYYCKICKRERLQWTYDLHKETKKKYQLENKEKIKQYRKKYYEENKEKILIWQKNYYEKNKYKYQENYLKRKGEKIGKTDQ